MSQIRQKIKTLLIRIWNLGCLLFLFLLLLLLLFLRLLDFVMTFSVSCDVVFPFFVFLAGSNVGGWGWVERKNIKTGKKLWFIVETWFFIVPEWGMLLAPALNLFIFISVLFIFGTWSVSSARLSCPLRPRRRCHTQSNLVVVCHIFRNGLNPNRGWA
jgi:hypothetical protein